MIPIPTPGLIGVVGAAVAFMIIGAIWFMPGVFGKRWAKLSGVKPGSTMTAGPLIGGFIGALIMSYVLGIIVKGFQATGFAEGAIVGLIAWVGFALTIGISNMVFEKKPMELIQINEGFSIINFLVMGAILGAYA